MPELTSRERRAGWLWLAFQMLFLPSLITAAAGLSGTAANFVYHLICFGAVWAIFHRFLRESRAPLAGNSRRAFPVAVVSLAVYYGAFYLLQAGIDAIDPEFSNVNDNSIQALGQEDMLLTALTTIVLAPLSEECFYRGLIFHTGGRLGRFWAYALSCLAFSAIHVAGYIGSYPALRLLLCFVQYLPAGLVLAGSMEATGSIFTPIFLHMLINTISVLQLIFC